MYIDCMPMSFSISFLIKNCSWKVFSAAAVAVPWWAWGLCNTVPGVVSWWENAVV